MLVAGIALALPLHGSLDLGLSELDKRKKHLQAATSVLNVASIFVVASKLFRACQEFLPERNTS